MPQQTKYHPNLDAWCRGARSEARGAPRRAGPSAAAVVVALVAACAGARLAPAEEGDRVARLNQAFLAHVRSLGSPFALAAGIVAQSWETYRDQMPESFVPDALAVLYPPYRDALAAFDVASYADAARLLAPLGQHTDPFLAANARYFRARCLVEEGLLEEAQAELQQATAPGNELAQYTPYVAHFWFLRAYCEASNLDYDAATQTLQALEEAYPDASEPVRVGARQLRLEIERRQRGTLDEAAAVMGYSAARLLVSDASERVRQRQAEVVDLLDRLIEQTEQQEREQGRGGGRQRQSGQQGNQPRAAAERSELPGSSPGEIGAQHAPPRADPGEMWGRLPPAEREKILQSLRDRFPSRYRQLVEQYYRSLAEQK